MIGYGGMEIKKNLYYALVAQIIMLVVSCSTNLILPKFVSTESFSYWQLFIFYITYIPCLALGLNDGVYLRYGGKHESELDCKSIKSQYIVGMIYQIILAIIVGGVLISLAEDNKRKIIMVLVIGYYIVYTGHNFLGYIFQAINKTYVYSKSIIIDRTIFFTAQIILIVLGIKNITFFSDFYIVSLSCAWLFLIISIYPYFKNTPINLMLGLSEAIKSMKIGISLMFANVCSLLILGVGRQIIDSHWGLAVFGKVSFSLTLINFALTFILQISMVLFPALRRINDDELRIYYSKLAKGLYIILPLMYILYLPAQYVLKIWLPNYSESIDYLSIILPICFFDSKMNLLGITFFKVLNEQVALLRVNILTIIFSLISGVIAAYVFNSINGVIIGMVSTIVFRSVLSNIILSKKINVRILDIDCLDILLALVFILTNIIFNWWISCSLIVGIYILRISILSKLSLSNI